MLQKVTLSGDLTISISLNGSIGKSGSMDTSHDVVSVDFSTGLGEGQIVGNLGIQVLASGANGKFRTCLCSWPLLTQALLC
jgi:hypothetical protein